MQCDICLIKNLVYRYADLVDRGDFPAVAALLADATILTGAPGSDGAEVVGVDVVEAMYRSFARLYEDDGTPHTLHVTTNVMVDLDADGSGAGARSYAVVFQALDDFPLQPIIGVRYYDRFLNTGEEWRFAERRIESRLAGDLSRHLLQPM